MKLDNNFLFRIILYICSDLVPPEADEKGIGWKSRAVPATVSYKALSHPRHCCRMQWEGREKRRKPGDLLNHN